MERGDDEDTQNLLTKRERKTKKNEKKKNLKESGADDCIF